MLFLGLMIHRIYTFLFGKKVKITECQLSDGADDYWDSAESYSITCIDASALSDGVDDYWGGAVLYEISN